MNEQHWQATEDAGREWATRRRWRVRQAELHEACRAHGRLHPLPGTLETTRVRKTDIRRFAACVCVCLCVCMCLVLVCVLCVSVSLCVCARVRVFVCVSVCMSLCVVFTLKTVPISTLYLLVSVLLTHPIVIRFPWPPATYPERVQE